jgi:hypothetical protein
MFDSLWTFLGYDAHPAPSCPITTPPSSLPYESSRVLLMKGYDPPFMNDYWDYPTKSARSPEVVYHDRLENLPLFSTKSQLISSTGPCAGKLWFSKSLHPDLVRVDSDGSLVTRPTRGGGFIVSSVSPPETFKCATSDGMIPAKFQIGGGGPGSAEMSSKILNGALKSTVYQQFGPHFLGRALRDGSMCIEPSAVDPRPQVVYELRAPGVPPAEKESLIQIDS